MAVRIILFSHKGGVSKTTSTYNIGWMLARAGKRVLLVDADSQCNLTGLILGDQFDTYYETNPRDNIKSALAPAFESAPIPLKAVKCYKVENNVNLFLMPGHINLSEYEVTLGIAHELSTSIVTFKNIPGSFNTILELTAQQYDIEYVLIDVNPSFSSINQNLFCSSDYFIIPTAPDYFSLMAIEALAEMLPKWEIWAKRARQLFQSSAYQMYNVTPKFLGTIVQNFSVRKGAPSQSFQNLITSINNKVKTTLLPSLASQGMTLEAHAYTDQLIEKGYSLAQISDFAGMGPKAQEAGSPVFEIPDEQLGSGPVLEQYKAMRERFRAIFSGLCDQIVRMTEQ